MNMVEFLRRHQGVENDPEQHKTAWVEYRDYAAPDYSFRRVRFTTFCSAGPKPEGEETEMYHDASMAWDAYWRALDKFIDGRKGILRWRMVPEFKGDEYGGFVISRVAFDEVELTEIA